MISKCTIWWSDVFLLWRAPDAEGGKVLFVEPIKISFNQVGFVAFGKHHQHSRPMRSLLCACVTGANIYSPWHYYYHPLPFSFWLKVSDFPFCPWCLRAWIFLYEASSPSDAHRSWQIFGIGAGLSQTAHLSAIERTHTHPLRPVIPIQGYMSRFWWE